jgi:FkbM family methyltransferase
VINKRHLSISKLFNHCRIKLRTSYKYLVFEKLGFPKIKNENVSKSLVVKGLRKNPVIVDCGAFDGGDSIELARLTGGTVYAFEANPKLFLQLKHNTRRYPSVKCQDIALSNVDGTANFHLGTGNYSASSSLLQPNEQTFGGGDFTSTVEVKTRKLSTWAKENNISQIDLLWLDMQGFELQMLEASAEMIKRPMRIYTEISTQPAYQGSCLYDDLKIFLEGRGYRLEIEAIPKGWTCGNAFFVPRDN